VSYYLFESKKRLKACSVIPSRGFFASSEGVNASRSKFTDKSTVVNNFITHASGTQEPWAEIADILKPADRCYHPCCMDGTRQYIFEEIEQWIADVDGHNILWLSGSPGSGKSAIASSMTARLTDEGRLYSHFSFTRDLKDPTALWRTVAYDLATKSNTYAELVLNALKNGRGDIKRHDIGLQFRFLIGGPLKKSFLTSPGAVVVIIDAWDKWDFDYLPAAQQNALLETFGQWSRLPKEFKLIITSRYERPPDSIGAECYHILLRTGPDVCNNTNNDIRRFFEKRFVDLPSHSFHHEWPPKHIINSLVVRAEGLFIWAEIVMELLEQSYSPEEQLDLALNGDLGKEDNLTNLYQELLKSSFRGLKRDKLDIYILVVSVIVLAKAPLHFDDVHHFLSESKPSVPEHAIYYIIMKLSPVISRTDDGRLRVRHRTFSEFMRDPDRCPEAFVIDYDQESKITMACFQQMKAGLKFNICRLEISFLRNDEVADLKERIKKHISEPLLYSCRFWATHLRCTANAQEGDTTLLLEDVRNFLNDRLLYWLEVMSLVEEVSVANTALRTAVPWVEVSSYLIITLLRFVTIFKKFDRELSAFAIDACRFIINFDVPISTSVPHIYLSALPFSPAESLVAKQYSKQFPNLLTVTGQEQRWPPMINLLRGHKKPVTAVTFSPDGKLVASGSSDRTVRVWDIEKCWNTRDPFDHDGHKGAVTAIAFSSDSKLVVSGSDDGTVCVWDVVTGQVIAGPYDSDGHESTVQSVAFLPDDKYVISCSLDGVIWIWSLQVGFLPLGPYKSRGSGVCSIASSPNGKTIAFGSKNVIHMWDVEMDQPIHLSLKGHKGTVTSVAFSSDGTRIASGSKDKTVCVWNTENGRLTTERSFEGHTDTVMSTAFSPSGKAVVSGSLDETIYVWNAETGEAVKGPLKGHIGEISSVAFSPDGKQVISGSKDKTIRIWDADMAEDTKGSVGDHEGAVYSVAFSPDGKQIMSGSGDCSVRVWNAETGQANSTPLRKHTKPVLSVAFSPDGSRAVSGSADKTICSWDMKTGLLITDPFVGHTDCVYSVAISWDGMRAASGSLDRTICIWNMSNGHLISKLFTGHKDAIKSVAFSPNGKHVVSGSWDGTVCVWDVDTGQQISVGPSQGHTDRVHSVAFSPTDGERIVSGWSSGMIYVWNFVTDCIKVIPQRHTDVAYSVQSVQFSQDGKRVVSGSSDGTICVWDVEAGQITASPIRCHTDIIYSVQFSPGGRQIVSSSKDRTIRVWDVEAFRILSTQRKSNMMGDISIACSRTSANLHDIDYLTWLTSSCGKRTGWLGESDLADNHPTVGHLLLWVPPTYRDRLYGDDTIAVLGTKISQLDLSLFACGDGWTKCCSPFTDPSPIPSTPSLVTVSSSQVHTSLDRPVFVQSLRSFHFSLRLWTFPRQISMALVLSYARSGNVANLEIGFRTVPGTLNVEKYNCRLLFTQGSVCSLSSSYIYTYISILTLFLFLLIFLFLLLTPHFSYSYFHSYFPLISLLSASFRFFLNNRPTCLMREEIRSV
jgi:WD40 repeat protein